MQRIVDSIGSPATVSNMRGDYLTANALGRALYAPLFDSREQPPNSARFTFLDPAAQEFFVDWEKAAKDLVAALRSEAGRNPYDRAAQRPRRRAVDPQRAVSQVVGRPQRPLPPDRPQAAAPPDRRRPRARLRGHGALGRQRPAPGRLQRRARQPLPEALDLLASWTATPDREPTSDESASPVTADARACS